MSDQASNVPHPARMSDAGAATPRTPASPVELAALREWATEQDPSLTHVEGIIIQGIRLMLKIDAGDSVSIVDYAGLTGFATALSELNEACQNLLERIEVENWPENGQESANEEDEEKESPPKKKKARNTRKKSTGSKSSSGLQ